MGGFLRSMRAFSHDSIARPYNFIATVIVQVGVYLALFAEANSNIHHWNTATKRMLIELEK